MKPVTLAHIGVRVLAVYMIAQGIMYLPSIHSVLLYGTAQVDFDASLVSAALAMIAGPLIMGMILWAAAPALSRRIAGPATPDEDTGSAVDAGRLHRIAVSTAGLVIAVLAVPEFAALLIQTLGGTRTFDGQTFDTGLAANTAAAGLKLLFGLVLVFGARMWVRLFHRFREFGLENK